MKKWILLGAVVCGLNFILLFGLGSPSHKPPSIPTSEALVDRASWMLNPPTRSPLGIVRIYVSKLPQDVVGLILATLVAGTWINISVSGADASGEPSVSPGWAGLLGSCVWALGAFSGSVLLVRWMASFLSSPVLLNWTGGLFLQIILLACVLCYDLAKVPEMPRLLPRRFFSLAEFKQGLIEYLRLYPYLIGALIANEWLLPNYFSSELPASYRFVAAATNLTEILLIFGLICVLAPITEELFFRGILYGSLRDYLPVYPAAVLGGGLFGLIHFEYQLVLPLWIFGSALCLVYERYNSFKVVIIMHFLQNTVSYYVLKRLI